MLSERIVYTVTIGLIAILGAFILGALIIAMSPVWGDTEINLNEPFTVINQEADKQYVCTIDEMEDKLLLLCLGD
jgi:hypothetical protein